MVGMERRIAIIEAPSNLGLKPPAPGRVPGVYRLPEALKAAGLAGGLNAVEGGRAVPPLYSPEREPQTGIRNSGAIREYAFQLAETIQGVLAEGYFPVVLGGDCSILLGSALALRRRGRYGLFFVDGHQDFLSPATSQTGGAAGMDLALVTGRGPDVLTKLDGFESLMRDSDVVVFGYRDLEYPAADPDYRMEDSGMTLFGLETARQIGIKEAVEEGLAVLRRNGAEGFWIHLDADVLDDEIMPAVDSRQPGGMSYAELVALLRTLLGSGAAAGLQITIYDPDLDPDGAIARAFASALIASFVAGERGSEQA